MFRSHSCWGGILRGRLQRAKAAPLQNSFALFAPLRSLPSIALAEEGLFILRYSRSAMQCPKQNSIRYAEHRNADSEQPPKDRAKGVVREFLR